MENHGSTEEVDVVKDSSGDGIQEDEDAEVFSSDMSSMAMSTARSGSSPHSSLQLPSASNDDRDVAQDGSVSGTKKLDHAPTGGKKHLLGLGMVDSLDAKKSHDVSPGAFPLQSPRNPATGQALRAPRSSYDSARDSTNEESKQEDGVPNSAGAYPGAHDSRRMESGGSVYTVEALCVPDGNEDGTMMVAEAQHLTLKWYQRPLYRWIFLGSILFACGLLGAVVVLVVRQPSAASSSSLMQPSTPVPTTAAPSTPVPTTAAPTTPVPTAAAPISEPIFTPISVAPPTTAPIAPAIPPSTPTTLTPEAIACNFLGISNVTKCRLTLKFGGMTIDSTIPSEIGLLTQLNYLSFYTNYLTSTIPSEIGLLTKLTFMNFERNSFTSTIPSEIGRLTQLTALDFSNNVLTSAIPSEIGLLTKLTYLDFEINSFTSTIQSAFGRLTQLELLDLSSNAMTSTIPSEMGLLTKLMRLFVDSNLFTSTIPSEIRSLTQLAVLSFFNNSLTSTIPSEIGLLTKLTELAFSNNELNSTIPSEMGHLTQLSQLFLRNNALTSSIPREIGRLTQLTYLDCDSNELTGTIPSSLCSLPLLYSSIFIDCGEIICASGCCVDSYSNSCG